MGEPIPRRTLADFVKEQKLRARRAPMQGTLETTFRCNLKCVHCYVNKAVGDAEEKARELTTERMLKLVDEVADAGCLELLLTGGEVLVRPDFEEVYLHAQARGLLVIVFTNGTLVTERIADFLAAHKPLRVEVSLYGMTPETYERVTDVPGSYAKCMRGIELLLARDVPLKLKTMVLTWNMHELDAMRAYAADRGLAFRYDGFLNPRVDCGANRNGELQVDPEALLALDLADPERMASFKQFCERFVPRERVEPRERVYNCGAGQTSFTVEPSGKLQLCQLSRRASFDLKKGSFDEGWNVVFPALREKKWQSNSVCRSCNLTSLCANCPGSAEMETGSIEGVIEGFCRATHLRAWAVLKEKSGHKRDGSCCLAKPRDEALVQLGVPATK